ncbi:MAG: glycosyltransferase family 4 protein [Eubacteriales bacterium]
MNLLIITDYAAPYEGNFIQSLKSLENRILKNGKMVYLFPLRSKEFDWVNDFAKIHKVYFFTSKTKDIINTIKNINKAENIDIIYSHFTLFKTQKAVKYVRVLNKKVKLVQHFHNHYFNVRNPMYKWCFNGDLNIGCSKSVGESLPYKKSTYVDNAIDFERLKICDENFEFAEKDKLQITMFGFDYRRKGVDIAIKAIEPIVEKLNIHLNIVVSVGSENIKEQIINDFGVVPSWINIIEARNDIATYLTKSKLFISSAREEGFCYALVEAGYCGALLISSKIAGVPYHIPNCNVFESEDVVQFTKVIRETILKHDTMNKEETKQYIEENYHINKWRDNIYNELMNIL